MGPEALPVTHELPRGGMFRLSDNFWSYEFDCHCGMCATTLVSQELVDKLEKLRELTKTHVVVTSGYRCAKKQESLRNAGLETSKGPSSHEKGWAADVKSGFFSGTLLAELARKAGFENVGVGRSFIHVDIRPGGPRSWGYQNRDG